LTTETVTPSQEVAEILLQQGGEMLRECYQCGTCTATCPWNQVTTFTIRKLIHKAQMGLVDFEDQEIWRCVGCRLCVDRCPRGVDVPKVIRAIRRVVMDVGAGVVPHALRIADKNLAGVGNPLGEPREKRNDWAKSLDVKTFTKDTEFLYFACCYQCYDSRCRAISRAAVNILKKAKVDFGILGAEQVCCGESLRKAGHESLYQSLARTNIEVFQQAGVKKILVTSPHCLHTFRDEYGEFGGNFEVIHTAQYISTLIEEGRIKPTKRLGKRVTYHDSCCLGRYAGMYDEPRQILQSIPGLELVEMRNTCQYALCCGGCAGRLWQETLKGERFAETRIEQALEIGASVLAVYCPYCMVNFEDSLLSSGKSESLRIADITELVEEAISA